MMNLKIRTFASMTALALTLTLPATAQEAGERKQMDMLSIAPVTLRQDLLQGVYEAIEVPERNELWVASTKSFDKAAPGFVDVLDATDLRLLRRIELPRRAFAMTYDQTRGHVYVGNTMDGSLTLIDAASSLIIDTIQLGKADGEGFEHTRMIEVDRESGRIIVTSPSETGTAWIVDPAADNAVQRIDNSGLWTAGLAVDEKRGRAYTTGGGLNEVLVLDVKTGERITTFSTGDTTAEGAAESKHFFVNAALDGDGKRLFAADANSGALYVFDTDSGMVVATAEIGLGTLDVAYASKQDLLFVTYRGVSREEPQGSGGVVVLNGADYTHITDIPLPAHPNSLTFGDDGDALFVTVKAPMESEHPLYREGGGDSVLRIDLPKLSALLATK